jgi:flagellar basal-body rod protein FlgB
MILVIPEKRLFGSSPKGVAGAGAAGLPPAAEAHSIGNVHQMDRLSQELSFFQQSLNLRADRQEVLSANIANADTPNYKARDFDFATAMQGAMDTRMRLQDTSLALTSPRHIPAQATSSSGPVDLLYRQPYQASLDGNTVDMNAERVQFADNAMHYQSSMSVMNQQLKDMLRAVSE